MAHEIESAMFVGQPAWHGLGVILNTPPTIDEAIIQAGLDWKVNLHPLVLGAGDGRKVDHFATVRDSDKAILGVVGDGYVPLQNVDAFKFFQPFVDSGECTLEAAGSLRGGQKVWVLAKIKDGTVDVQTNDPIEQYILLSNGHNGHMTIRVGFTVTRVVCANTLKIAHDNGKLLKVRHTTNAVDALDKIRDIMDLVRTDFAATSEQLRTLVNYGCNEEKLKRYVREVFQPGQADNEKAAIRTVNNIIPLFEAGRGAELSRGTMWGAFNAVTEFLTHERGESADNRVHSLWFQQGGDVVARALDTALEFCAAA